MAQWLLNWNQGALILDHTLWSAKLLTKDPELIKQVHYDYLIAGADVITQPVTRPVLKVLQSMAILVNKLLN